MKQRLISAIVLLLILIPCLYIGGIPYILLVMFAGLAGLYEIIKIIKTKNSIPLFIELVNYIILIFFIINNYSGGSIYSVIDYKLISTLILVNLIPLVLVDDKEKYNLSSAFILIGLVLFLGISFNLAVILRAHSVHSIIYIFLITIFNDSFAYVTGMLIGRHHFTDLSPKKTIEGCIGGALMGTTIASIYYFTFFSTNDMFLTILLTFIISIISQIGDLVFSYFKREFNVKDFSNLIPGHGGVLDRLDSIIFALLGFVVFSSIL